MKHFQFSPLRSGISSSRCKNKLLTLQKHIAKRGPGFKLAWHNPHIWFSVQPEKELHDFQAFSSDYKETK